jgi:hypothetical protein
MSALYPGRGVRVYAVATILGALLTLVLAVAVFARKVEPTVSWSLTFSLIATGVAFVGTARSLRTMQALWETAAEGEVRVVGLLDTWDGWHVVGAASHACAFLALVVAVAYT